MQCQTVRPDVECYFWKKNGCHHKDGSCQPIVEQCQGCTHIVNFAEKQYCKAYPDPAAKWLNAARCASATHVQPEEKKVEEKKITTMKASKRTARGG